VWPDGEDTAPTLALLIKAVDPTLLREVLLGQPQ
jgi:hypothetical protein